MLQSSSSDRLRYLKAIKAAVQSMKLQSAELEGLKEKRERMCVYLCVRVCTWFAWLVLCAPAIYTMWLK